ncbi:tetratricopeptide repeat protein 9C [Clupea harengus]|uniref:Tetratricopeptide repeat protein 9C n=1 Tax=Clupea harengus TaxID=7950 RepID=A0A8M1KEU2_CLUHA|nr:tetratricopeptide repeat protein 9C [Clupea harengus]
MADDGEKSEDATEQATASCSASPNVHTTAPIDCQLQEAVRLKTEGNTFYRDKNIRSAIGRYHRALIVLRGLDPKVTSAVEGFGPKAPVLNSEQQELLRNTQIDCYNNLAACLLQRESVDYSRVQEYSLRVLQLRPGDIKALYRAGVATLELGDAQSARQYLLQASRGKPNDANVKRQLQRVEERLSKEYLKEKALYKGMFSQQKNEEGQGDMATTQKHV